MVQLHNLIPVILNHFVARAESKTPGGVPIGRFEGIGPLGNSNLGDQNVAVSTFTRIITNAIGVMTIVAFIWFLFVLFIGAISWISAGGDAKKTQNAAKQITSGIIGLVIVVSAIFIIRIIGKLLGIEFLDVYNQILQLEF